MLEVKLYDEIIGNIVILKDGRSLFSFSEEYINNIDKPTLSQSFLSESNNLILHPKAESI